MRQLEQLEEDLQAETTETKSLRTPMRPWRVRIGEACLGLGC